MPVDPAVSTTGTTDISQWKSTLAEEIRNDPGIKDFKEPAEVVKAYINLQKMLGNAIRPPGPDAPADDIKKFQEDLKAKVPGVLLKTDTDAMWDALGRPKTADAYTPPENVKLPDEELMSIKKFALENGYTVEQAKGLYKVRAQQHEDKLAARARHKESLKTEWGQTTEERTALAVATAEKMGAPKELVEAARSGDLDAGQMKWLYNVAKSLGTGDGNSMGREPAAPRAPSMTPSEAESQIAELQKSPAWRNEGDPRHQQLIHKMVELVEIANAGKPVGDGVGHVMTMTGIAPDRR